MAERRIRIQADPVVMEAVLNESETARKVWDALPLEVRGNTWGDEIYFPIPVEAGPEHPREVVDVGDIAYWPPGNAFCIFFGPTPASRGDECRPASPVNLLGRLDGDPLEFRQTDSGTTVRVERVSP